MTFTQPVDPASAANLAAYDLSTYTYIYQSAYGSPEVDPTRPKINAAQVAENGLSVRLSITGLQRGHVHELRCDLKNTEGLPLLHQTAYYTLNYLPE